MSEQRTEPEGDDRRADDEAAVREPAAVTEPARHDDDHPWPADVLAHRAPGEAGDEHGQDVGDRDAGDEHGQDAGEEDASDGHGRDARGAAHDDAGLLESHAWQVSADAVGALPHEDSAVPAVDPALHAAAGPPAVPQAEEPAVAPSSSSPHAHLRPTGWAALRIALRPRGTRAQVLAGVLCAVLGFAIVVQLRQNGDASLSQLRQDDLVRLLDEASTRSDQLSQEAADLQRERDQLVSGSNTRQAALDAARRSAATQGILAGRLPAVGPGVRITLTDDGGSIRPITMLNMLEELRNAGAEAVQLNDQRVTASSAFTGSPGAVQLDGTTLSAPYEWLVIGDPDTIATALDIPGGAMAYVRNDGGSGSVDKLQVVHVDALRPVVTPRYATPAAAGGS